MTLPAIALLLLAALVLGCSGNPPLAPSAAPSGTAAPSTVTDAQSPTPTGSEPPPSDEPASTASASAAVTVGPLAGPWRVRRVLAPEDRADFLPGVAFSEEAFRVTPGCAAEPCDSIEVQATPAGRSRPITTTTLTREGDHYVSASTPIADVPCRNAAGDRVPGGASASSTMQLWLTTVRPTGSAVESIVLQGTVDLALTPTTIGQAAGCTAEAARYDLSGRVGAVAVLDRPSGVSGIPAGVATAALPVVDVAIQGAEIRYFDVEGTTADELGEAVGRGALRACGGIDYEWLDGDTTPAACTITSFPAFERTLDERTGDDGSCRIEAEPDVHFVVHVPRWSGPDLVPAALVDWWRATVEFIRDHEAGHVRISSDHVVGLEERLDGAACDAVDGVVQNWAVALGEAQEFYDRREYARAWPEPPPGF